GAFAILKSRSPNSSVTQIFNALDATGIAVTDSRNNVTKKRIKIDAALNALPGNDKIVFVNKTNNSYDIYTMNADGTNRFRVTNDGSEKKSPSFSPDGKKILYDGVDGFYTINADGTNPVRVYNSYYANNPSFSPDGTKIVFSEDRQIYTINADGSSLRQITNLNGVALTPSWSPDGTKITFSAYEAPFFTYAVWVINADGTGVVKLTGTSFTALAPRFSPDGTKIVFYVSNSGAFEGINIINSNGSSLNNPTRITTTWRDKDPSFSSDGSRILFVNDSPPDYIPSIYTINADGTNRKLVGIADDQFFPNWYLPVAQNSASMATTVGQNIPAPLNDTVSLVFDNVTTAGNTIATALAANQLQPLPSGFTLPANAPKYEIATSANFTGSVNVTFNVPGIAGAAACSPLRILHYTNNVWDSANNAAPIFNAGTGVCTLRQTVTSLSPFVVAQQAFSPTSAPVTVSGRVSAASGRGVRGARVTITGPNGEQRITVSNSLGYYLFADVAAGATYVFSVSAKGRVFQNPTQARTIIEDTSDVNFVAAN
ncbi:MAG TPA: carboxypeptidase regulatory-like domain-containing protein, partial [Pyrinomonadaceae bacterium]|nr:carboxypeptidase regulatory-like domain-containing protein [Pyrinomonadaceae bacterium]